MDSAAQSERCPICQEPSSAAYVCVPGRRAGKNQMFQYLQCGSCGTVFLSFTTPQPADIYSETYFKTSAALRFFENVWTAFNFWLRWWRMPRVARGSRVLDIGCGTGTWLRFLQRRGLQIEGLDASPEAVKAAAKNGVFNVTQGTLNHGVMPINTFDVITVIHCLEHDPDPGTFVGNAMTLLKPGGWLGIAIPNISSWEATRAAGNWFHLDPPFHLCLPSGDAMRPLLERAGLTHIRVGCPVFEYCQSLMYAMFKTTRIKPWLLILMLPWAVIWNGILGARKKAGVIEYWAQKPSSLERA